MVDDGPALEGVVLARRYRLGRLIGSGGMARVVEAHDERLDRRVAVKLVAADVIDDVERQRFLDEARAGASFVHPNAVAVYDAGADGGWLYLVMEIVDGPTLAEVLAERGPLPAHEAVRIVDRVLDALAGAHTAGLVHRDVKPGNVLLGEEGSVKLADFGIAKRLDHGPDDLTVAGQFVGTPRYLAPEQLAGERATPASDVYGVGIVLFELLSGRPPFDGDNLIAIALAHRDRPVPALPTGTAPGLAAVVVRALAKEPADRFPDAAAMQAALRGAPVTEIMPTPPPGPGAAPPIVPTQVAPTPIRPVLRRDRRLHLWRAIAIATLLALIAGLALRMCAGDPDSSADSDTTGPAAADATATEQATAAATAATVTATAATVTMPPPVPPATVADLIAVLTMAPTAFGDAGPDLLDGLAQLDGLNGQNERDAASELVDQVQAWRDEGRLDAVFADQVLTVITPLSVHPGDANRNDNANDNGGGDD